MQGSYIPSASACLANSTTITASKQPHCHLPRALSIAATCLLDPVAASLCNPAQLPAQLKSSLTCARDDALLNRRSAHPAIVRASATSVVVKGLEFITRGRHSKVGRARSLSSPPATEALSDHSNSEEAFTPTQTRCSISERVGWDLQ